MNELPTNLSGLPLKQKVEILKKKGLAVEGTHANGVTEVSVTPYEDGVPGEAQTMKVNPIVVWNSDGQATTLFVPRA